MTIDDLEKIQPLIDKFVEKWNEIWELVKKKMNAICDTLDKIRVEIQHRFPACRSRRYALAKKISKFTSMEVKEVYRMLRPMYYARGSC